MMTVIPWRDRQVEVIEEAALDLDSLDSPQPLQSLRASIDV